MPILTEKPCQHVRLQTICLSMTPKHMFIGHGRQLLSQSLMMINTNGIFHP